MKEGLAPGVNSEVLDVAKSNVALPVVEIGGSKVVKICRSQTLALPPTCGNALSMRWLAIVRPEVKVAHSADISDHSQK